MRINLRTGHALNNFLWQFVGQKGHSGYITKGFRGILNNESAFRLIL